MYSHPYHSILFLVLEVQIGNVSQPGHVYSLQLHPLQPWQAQFLQIIFGTGHKPKGKLIGHPIHLNVY